MKAIQNPSQNIVQSIVTIQQVTINTSNVSQLREDITTAVMSAENNQEEARKIFGVDRMTPEQRRTTLRKATLVCFPDVLNDVEAHYQSGPRSH